MSPEQLAGTEVTVKSDIYALGLVLYELFTGKRAFEAASLMELMQMQERAEPASISSIARDLDPGVETIVMRCLDPSPSGRPAPRAPSPPDWVATLWPRRSRQVKRPLPN
jgi:serine/threonine-protein kinase